MDPERLKELSGNGGRKAHALGKAHKWTSSEAREAGLISVKLRRLRRNTQASIAQLSSGNDSSNGAQ